MYCSDQKIRVIIDKYQKRRNRGAHWGKLVTSSFQSVFIEGNFFKIKKFNTSMSFRKENGPIKDMNNKS